MGSVYLVEHVHTGQELALKVLNPKMVENTVALERFRRESRAPARIQSDHVVQVTDADVASELKGAPFLVMELLRGHSFDQLMASGPIPPKDALLYLSQIARALDKAHQLGIVHRDIKPENLFLTRRDDGTPCVKLLDFGIAKLTEGSPDAGEVSKTATGAIFGTPLYMAPEQMLGRTDKVSGKTDVWALGIMAHRMLVGIEPWTAQTLPHLVAQIAYEPLPRPSDAGSTFGVELDDWFLHCCAREPEDRFATASEAVAALAHALSLDPIASSSQLSSPFGASKPPSRPVDSDALAETAVASTGSAIGSDTLSAQVAPKKSNGPVVLAAFGIVVLLVFGAYLAFRGPEVKSEPAVQPPPQMTGQTPTSAPSTQPAVEPTVSAEAPPTASQQKPTPVETQTAKRPPPVAVPRPPSTGKGKPNSGKPPDDVMDSRK